LTWPPPPITFPRLRFPLCPGRTPLDSKILEFIIAAPAIIFSLVAHEYAHAAAAFRQGDDTAYRQGRLTMNPMPHIDPFMTILVPALTLWASGGRFLFGGAKPVPVDPRKYRELTRGDIIVSSAGVITNFVLVFVFALLFVAIGLLARATPGATSILDSAQRMMMWGININVILCFFNLLPIPPLDGSHLFYYLLPPAWGMKYRELQRFGFLIILAIVMLVPGLLGWLLTPARIFLAWIVRAILPFALGDGWRIFG
jgi:Zn-dependent protease